MLVMIDKDRLRKILRTLSNLWVGAEIEGQKRALRDEIESLVYVEKSEPVEPTISVSVEDLLDLHRRNAQSVGIKDRVLDELVNFALFVPEDDNPEQALFMTEAYLYESVGKETARSILGRFNNLVAAMGGEQDTFWSRVYERFDQKYGTSVRIDFTSAGRDEEETLNAIRDFRTRLLEQQFESGYGGFRKVVRHGQNAHHRVIPDMDRVVLRWVEANLPDGAKITQRYVMER